MNSYKTNITIYIIVCVTLFLTSCNTTKHVGEGQYLLTKNVVNLPRHESAARGTLLALMRQKPNTKWFSTFRVPLAIYSLAGRDSTTKTSRLLRKWGEPPVLLDSTLMVASARDLEKAMQNNGYLDVSVEPRVEKKPKEARVTYNVNVGEQYTIRNIGYNISDSAMHQLMQQKQILSHSPHIGPKRPFSVNALQNERNRITTWLGENGYIYFNKEAITFSVDSSHTEKEVDVTMNIGLFRRSGNEPLQPHPRFWVNKVDYQYFEAKPILRARTLDINTLIRPGSVYNETDVQKTYSRFSKLSAIRSTNIKFTEKAPTPSDSLPPYNHLMDVTIQLQAKKPHSIQLQPEGTNTAGDFGAAISATYENRNLFRGSETFTLSARGAFEAIKGLEGYQRNNFTEYSIEGKLSFPEFIIPGISREFMRQYNAKSELSVSYNKQNRPEFHRRVFTGSWRYKWQRANGRMGFQYDFIDLNYISMPWISPTFKHDYLDSNSNRNAILRYNYENLLIMKMGMGITYNDGTNLLKINLETAGNTLTGMARLFRFSKNDDGQYKFALVAFAQYAKTDIDYTHLKRIDSRNTLALHARLGVAMPYGNSSILPFEKRYFSGGANSVRGWSVRELGPGRYRGNDGRIDFINQTGDVKIDLNAELRTDLFWKFQGAVFVDAGNIWTLKAYKEQPNGKFTISGLYEDMAVAYGLGLRLNIGYFILRLDMGMKAINPCYTTHKEHYPVLSPKFNRDATFHFAVGLPF